MFRRKEEHTAADTASNGVDRTPHTQTTMQMEQPAAGLRQSRPAPQRGDDSASRLRKPVPARDTRPQQTAPSNRFERTPRAAQPTPPAETPVQAPVSAASTVTAVASAPVAAPAPTATAMRMPLATKEPLPSPAVEELKQSVADRMYRAGGEAQPRTSEKRVLTVGQDTVLKGEIATCDRLIVEGTVDAVLSDVHTIEIAEYGTFKGAAKVEDAEISGQFDGDLEVKGCLTVYETGRITGKVTYSEIEIHRGGIITGKVLLAGSSARGNSKQETLLEEEKQTVEAA